MAYLMMSGNGWTQRWRVAPGMEEHVLGQIAQVGTNTTSRVPVVDPGSDSEVTLMVAWEHVATAALLDGPTANPQVSDSAGQYA